MLKTAEATRPRALPRGSILPKTIVRVEHPYILRRDRHFFDFENVMVGPMIRELPDGKLHVLGTTIQCWQRIETAGSIDTGAIVRYKVCPWLGP